MYNMDTSTNDYGEVINYLNNLIPDDTMFLSLKLDLPNDFTEDDVKDFDDLIDVRSFIIEQAKSDVIIATAGIHFKGKNEKPHLHYCVACKNFKKPSNCTNWKKAWIKKSGVEDDYFEGWSFKFKNLMEAKCKYNPLAYPFKEGHVVKRGCWVLRDEKRVSIPFEVVSFMEARGKQLYAEAMARHESEERRVAFNNNTLGEMLSFAVENKGEFSTKEEMAQFFETEWLNKFENVCDKPAWNNYEKNLKVIAQHLGLYNWGRAVRW